jgi:hypothetical protein
LNNPLHVKRPHFETKEERERRMQRDDAEIRKLDKEAYTWSAPELNRLKNELENDFEELMTIASGFDDTPARQRLFDFCFKITRKIVILDDALKIVKENKAKPTSQAKLKLKKSDAQVDQKKYHLLQVIGLQTLGISCSLYSILLPLVTVGILTGHVCFLKRHGIQNLRILQESGALSGVQ